MRITQAQSRAIAHGKGPAMVLAGPGSGKTLVIVNRVKYLTEQYGVKPEEILVVTFTRAAAAQMKERFERLAGGRSRTVFGTLHGVFFQILKHAYHYTAADILREEEKYQILSGLAQRLRLEYEDEKEFLADLAAEIGRVKNEGIRLEHFYSAACPEEEFRKIYTGYQEQLRRRGKIDFDDMLVYCCELFSQRPDILRQWQKRFRYILVDEFQDINGLQYQVVRILAEPERNLFIVGDDDQSIYRFRGARPEIMRAFTKDYPEAEVIVLDENFRSVRTIVQASSQVIRENENRFEKKIRCGNEEGAPVEIRAFSSQEKESAYLVCCIRSAIEKGAEYGELAVLTRTNVGGRSIAERLMEFQIPFRTRDAMPSLYDHWIARDVFAYLRLALGIRERKDFLQVMNRPTRYISRECVEDPVISFDRLRMWYEDKPWMVERLDRMEENLERMGRMRPFAAVNFIRHGIEYESYLKEYAAKRRIKEEELLEVLDELQESARNFRTSLEWFAHVEEYQRRLQEKSGRQEEEENAVTLSTLHSVKGLEFTEVFILDVNEGVIPHRKAFLAADIEEERRLFYVGMTRAKKRLHLFYIKERYGKRMEPSCFLEVFDLP